MAVENVDFGSLIAGAIDRFYEQLDTELAWYEQECRKVDLFIEEIIADYLDRLKRGLIEGSSDFGDDPEYDPAARAAWAQWQQQQAGAKAPAVEQPSGEAPTPRARAPKVAEKSPDYRRGYKTGWKAAHGGHPAQPDASQGEDYVRGYQEGHNVSGHAQAVTKHYENAMAAHAAGNPAEAVKHVGQANAHAHELVKHHLGDWAAESAGRRGMPLETAAQEFADVTGKMLKPTVRKTKAGGVPLVGNRSSMVDAIHHFTKAANAAPDEEEGQHHPANFGKQLGNFIGGYGARERKKAAGRAVAGHGGEGGDESGGGGAPEQAASVMTPEQLATEKERLARHAWDQEELKAHVAQHGTHPLEHYSNLEDAKAAAVEHWKHRVTKAIHQAQDQGDPMFKPHPIKTDKVGPDGKPITTNFDVGKAMTAVYNHPKGAFATGAISDAIRAQIPEYTGRNHWAHPIAQRLYRTADALATKKHVHFGRAEPMVAHSQQVASGKARKMSYGGGYHAGLRGQAEEIIGHMLGLFEEWLRENVDADEASVDLILESLSRGATERFLLLDVA